MSNETTKLMQWKRIDNSDNVSGLSLYLSYNGHEWHHYTNPLFKQYRVSESNIEGASKGFPTAANCLKHGFKYLPTESNV